MADMAVPAGGWSAPTGRCWWPSPSSPSASASSWRSSRSTSGCPTPTPTRRRWSRPSSPPPRPRSPSTSCCASSSRSSASTLAFDGTAPRRGADAAGARGHVRRLASSPSSRTTSSACSPTRASPRSATWCSVSASPSVTGLTGGLVHLFNHALMKSGLFLAMACVAAAHRARPGSTALRGLGRRMPLTMAAFVVGGLSLIGVPLTVGFVSKWYLVLGALEAGLWPVAVLILLSSLLALVYVWRVVEVAYFQPAARGRADEVTRGAAEPAGADLGPGRRHRRSSASSPRSPSAWRRPRRGCCSGVGRDASPPPSGWRSCGRSSGVGADRRSSGAGPTSARPATLRHRRHRSSPSSPG